MPLFNAIFSLKKLRQVLLRNFLHCHYSIFLIQIRKSHNVCSFHHISAKEKVSNFWKCRIYKILTNHPMRVVVWWKVKRNRNCEKLNKSKTNEFTKILPIMNVMKFWNKMRVVKRMRSKVLCMCVCVCVFL